MIFRRLSVVGLGFLSTAACLAIAGCVRTIKYVEYRSPFKDFECSVPAEWPVIIDGEGKDYYQILFTGPFEPSFFHGVPSLSVRWYRANAPHHLPDGSYEMYASAQDFMDQMLRDVYGPNGYFKGGTDREQETAATHGQDLPDVQGVQMPDDKHLRSGERQLRGMYFIAYNAISAPAKEKDGVVTDDRGHRIIRERHGYVVVPVRNGFYVLAYPATLDGFDQFRPAFFEMINTFRLMRAGPA